MPINVALESLTADAAMWETVSGNLNVAAASAGELFLPAAAFSFAGTAAASTYEEVRARVEQMLRQGANETAGAATVLRQVRADYESTDERTRAGLDGLWTID